MQNDTHAPASSSSSTRPAFLLDHEAATDAALVGNKAARLADLRGRGFNVPPGIVLSAPFCESAPSESAIASALNEFEPGTQLVAVRSSGIAEDGDDEAMAGRYRTELDVAWTDVPASVLRCIAAALRADEREGRPHQPVAILIQPMVPADRAGVAFSRDPVTGDEVRVVSGVAGLGESLVSGLSLGEDWVVGADGPLPRGAAEVLTSRQVAEIASVLDRIEDSLGGPQDVEWAIAGDDLFVLQARPITALPVAPPDSPLPAGVWVKDVTHYPNGVTPLAASVYLPALEAATRHAFPMWGLLVERAEQVLHKHEVYMQVIPLGGPKSGPPPPAWLMGIVARVAPPLRRAAKTARAALDSGLAERLVNHWEEHERVAFDDSLRGLRAVELPSLDDEQVVAHFERCVEQLHAGQRTHFALLVPYAMALVDLLKFQERHCNWPASRTLDLVAGLSGETSGPARALRELARVARETPTVLKLLVDPRLDEDALRSELTTHAPEFTAQWAEFIERWGHRVLSYDLGDPTLAERPAVIRRSVVELAQEPSEQAEALASRRTEAEAMARDVLPEGVLRDFDELLATARKRWPLREENVAFTDSMTNAVCRYATLEIGRRLTARQQLVRAEDVAMLSRQEMLDGLRSGADLRELTRRRHAERAWVAAHPGPAVLGGKDFPPPDTKYLPESIRKTSGAILWMVGSEFSAASRDVAGDVIQGKAAAPGKARGPVRIVNGPRDFHRVRMGDVLVCPTTTPAWTVLFPTVAAIVAEGGGVLAHPAIAAREHHLPAVVGAANARSRLVDGQIVEVDGTAGLVRDSR